MRVLEALAYHMSMIVVSVSAGCVSVTDPRVSENYVLGACRAQMLNMTGVPRCGINPMPDICDIKDQDDYANYECRGKASCLKLHKKVRQNFMCLCFVCL